MQDIARWGVIVPLFLIPFLVLFVPSDLFFLFITGKGFAFRILVEIAFASWAILALLDPRYRPKFSWPIALYGGLVLWMVIANAFAVSPMKAFWGNFERMEGWITILHVFLFLVVMGSFLSVENLWRRWWLAFLAASALVSVYSAIQLMCAGQACGSSGQFFQIRQGGVRVDGTLGNAIYLAQFLIFAAGIAAWQAITAKGALKYWLFALTGLHLLIMYFTATRGAIGAVILAVMAGALWYAVEQGGMKRRIAAGAFALLVIASAGIFLARDSAWVQQEPTLDRLVSVFSADEWKTRVTMWGIAGEGFAERPIAGWGQEGFNYVFNAYYKPSLYGQEQWFDRAHNLYLDWLIAGGLPAFVLIIVILLSGAYALRRADPVARIMLIGILFAYAVQSIVSFDNLFTYIPVAAVLAYAHALSARPVRRVEEFEADPALVQNLGIPLAAIAVILAFCFVHVPGIRTANDLILGMTPAADYRQNLAYFKRAADRNSFAAQEVSEQTVNYAVQIIPQASIPADVRAAFAEQAIAEIERELVRRPLDARIWMEASLAYRSAGYYDEAVAKTERALELSPGKQPLMLDLGTLEWLRGDTVQAKAWFDAAYALKPDADQLAIYKALGHVISGDDAGADAFLIERFGTKTPDSDLLLYAYFESKQYDRAAELLIARMEAMPSITTGFQLATVYGAMERYADARRAIDDTIRAFPEARTQGDLLYKEIIMQ